jgi:5'(3')-deoxyribonucleotidase
MKAILDMDGVLVDFVNGSLRHHGLTLDPYPVGKWNFVLDLDITEKEFFQSLGKSFWEHLDWMPDGKEILAMVLRNFRPEDVCLLTSPCDTEGCIDGKRAWIAKHMPDFSRRVLFGSAKEFVAGPQRILIDDSDSNCEKFVKAGGNSVLVPRIWNKDHGHPASAVQAVEMRILDILENGPAQG